MAGHVSERSELRFTFQAITFRNNFIKEAKAGKEDERRKVRWISEKKGKEEMVKTESKLTLKTPH